MKIATRVSLQYSVVFLVSLLLMGGVVYYEFVFEPAAVAESGLPPQPVGEELAETILLYGVPTVGILLSAGLWLLRRALRPLERMRAAAEGIHEDSLHQRLPRTNTGDELDRLAVVFNSMMVRLEGSFSQIQDFTLHASHELKTPLAILRGQVESLLNDESTSPAQRDLFADQLDEIDRLARIVDGLALLARADLGELCDLGSTVRLDDLVRESFADACILAQTAGIRVTLGRCDPAELRGDRHRLRQLLLNLTDNAIKYNIEGGTVTIELRNHERMAVLTISNTGCGIPAVSLPRVFARFYRGDAARHGAVEGCGLGLSISERIVKAHHGWIGIQSRPGDLTTVTVRIPIESRPAPSQPVEREPMMEATTCN
jgi:signal transduction histidine kinase